METKQIFIMGTFIVKGEVNARETLKPETIVPACADEKIAAWVAEKGGFFVKIYQDGDGWFAITHKDYKGPGLVVFIKEQPNYGQKLKITKVSRHVAYADLV